MTLSRVCGTLLLFCLLVGCGDSDEESSADRQAPTRARHQVSGHLDMRQAPLPKWTAVADPPAQPAQLPDTRLFPCELPYLEPYRDRPRWTGTL